ncbi:MAG: hypothetical protein ABI443_09240 [Chthoniobacterales bacterium]
MKNTRTLLFLTSLFAVIGLTHNVEASLGDKLPPSPGPGEASRVRYVNTLIAMHDELMPLAKTPKWTPSVEARFEAINSAIRKHPMPANSDSKVLSKLLVGTWRSPRHDYLDRSNGTWTMLPIEGKNTTHGTWSIKGNQFHDGNKSYPILMLSEHDFVFADGKTVFFEKRISHRE